MRAKKSLVSRENRLFIPIDFYSSNLASDGVFKTCLTFSMVSII
ncbi:hypothetical protein SAMN02745753_00743 [Marinomonas polaris DSM 16579]|uniref:Uncharacterized protein n=1 Tax=Marinomonas polaris DSM 16579 TaxID=1122206 RepID=A0A1M4VU23_9GAMM|nr:hypothetical protein SAMN02745753_00743 [Marinomonas polaris DSM 16579]